MLIINKTYKLLHRLALIQGEITNKSFKYCYGGKLLGRQTLIKLGIVEPKENEDRKAIYRLLITPDEINLELVSRIIVEVYLTRNDVEPLW